LAGGGSLLIGEGEVGRIPEAVPKKKGKLYLGDFEKNLLLGKPRGINPGPFRCVKRGLPPIGIIPPRE